MKGNFIGIVAGLVTGIMFLVFGLRGFFSAKAKYKEALKEYDPNKWLDRWYPGANPGKEEDYVLMWRVTGIIAALVGLFAIVVMVIEIYKAL